MTLGVYEQYDNAQQAVDHLADEGFPVQNVETWGPSPGFAVVT